MPARAPHVTEKGYIDNQKVLTPEGRVNLVKDAQRNTPWKVRPTIVISNKKETLLSAVGTDEFI
jgi:hypothetical protein